MAESEAALELGARRSDMIKRKLAKLDEKQPLNWGQKMSDVLEESKIQTFLKLTKIGKNTKSQKGGKKKVLLKDNQVPICNTRDKFRPHWMDFCIISEQQPFSWTQMDSWSYDHSTWTCYTFLPLRGSLRRKPGKAT
ncbi:hypothetical protein HYC85_029211 [Camellia sinensis]|uniref:Uncharacterized protein n=1 Tax=Camellia sinensis TaxID=4442 RepID=A0A7J7FXC6_CAMSI|nr:hypothetical protein HYC85_029211 [Camellia sinensis]